MCEEGVYKLALVWMELCGFRLTTCNVTVERN